jgi:putative RecB family exonuclease
MMPAIYSHSALKTFRDCPRQFAFRYIEKPSVPKRVGAEAYLGNAAHRVLQKLYQRGADGVEIPLDTAIKLYHDEWAKLDKETVSVVADFMGVDDYIDLGEEMLKRYYHRYRPFRHGTLLGTEMILTFTLPGTSFKIRGIIDRLSRREDGVVEICDYKTGRRLPRPQDPDFFYQMGLYQLAVSENFPQYEEIDVVQQFLRLDEEVQFRFTAADLEKLVEDIRVAIVLTLQAEKMNEFPPSESPLCEWCDYRHLCPAKRHRLALEDEEQKDRDPVRTAHEKTTEYIEKYYQHRQLAGELDALKEELKGLAAEMGVTKLAGDSGEISISSKREEKFLTKSEDPKAFALLSAMARDLGLEAFFKLDGNALMKEMWAKERFDKETKKLLEPYVRQRETVRVTVRRIEPEDEE